MFEWKVERATRPHTKGKPEMTKPYKPCECRAVFAYNITLGDTPEALKDGDDPNTLVSNVYQACGAETRRTFAPGHDAKLKGVLINEYRAGRDYAFVDGSLLVHVDPMTKATELGWAHFLTESAPKPVKASKPKAEKATKASKQAKPGFHPVRVKIGRWVYDAAVEAEDVNALTVTYRDKKGNLHTADVQRSQLVEG